VVAPWPVLDFQFSVLIPIMTCTLFEWAIIADKNIKKSITKKPEQQFKI
jgi:hypothetical protein